VIRRYTLVLGLALSASANALEPPGEDELNMVVVTATRTEIQLLELAGNISVIDSDRIKFTQPQRPSQILNQLAGVNIQQGGGEEHLTAIRSPVLNGGAGQGSFLFLEDGVPLRAAGFANVNGLYEANLEQAESVELVRGPGSALYGSNAVHGMINIIPRAPSTALAGELDVTGGMFGTWRERGTLSDTDGRHGFRVSAENNHESGWRDNSRLDEQKLIIRDVWSGTADKVTSTLSGQLLNQQTGAYITGKDAFLTEAVAKTNPIPDAYRKADSFRGMARWHHEITDSLDLSLTPYMRHTGMEFLMSYLPSQAIQRNAHTSVGIQKALYKTLKGGHLVILGADAEYTDGWYTEFQNKPTFIQAGSVSPHGLHYDLGATSRVAAPYIHSEWRLLDRTRLIAGIRLENSEYDYTNHASSGIFGLYQRPTGRKDSFITVTPKLGAVQQWQDGFATYVNLTRGARAPQVTDLYELQNKQSVGQVKAESIDSAEIGSRGRAGRMIFDGAAYWMAKNHYFYRAADGTNVPDGKTLHRGVELTLSAPLPAHFDIGTTASYALHSYAFNRADSTRITRVRKGSVIPEAPRTLANLRLGYSFLQNARAEVEWIHMGSYFTDNADTHAYGGHELFNFRIVAALTENISLHAEILNLTDRAYADRAAITTTGVDQYLPGAPRMARAGITARF
jgi:outer membrane receptor protein involved in Fe transport